MFDNIGGKIKGLAKIICGIGIGASIIVGLFSFADLPEGIIYGILIATIGSLFSWIGSFFAYGFGELIEKACEIEKNTRNKKI